MPIGKHEGNKETTTNKVLESFSVERRTGTTRTTNTARPIAKPPTIASKF